ncbi:MAG: hypothetical protein B9J98_00035 [Candidatus Terraquivivens tikiterensis]|uniref:Uncharacterized protein n=1 Tax=Candidatus Terraquivivens tikiterensis TaxID=1980982 RepID=A0A2R7YA42_9ARCH|nr:MAG: hypothetical protein B9J98_00035 [Candidatus Terraquivivens tikiterensis]
MVTKPIGTRSMREHARRGGGFVSGVLNEMIGMEGSVDVMEEKEPCKPLPSSNPYMSRMLLGTVLYAKMLSAPLSASDSTMPAPPSVDARSPTA